MEMGRSIYNIVVIGGDVNQKINQPIDFKRMKVKAFLNRFEFVRVNSCIVCGSDG